MFYEMVQAFFQSGTAEEHTSEELPFAAPLEAETGGFHLFEFHLPSSGISVVALMAGLAILLCVCACCRHLVPLCCQSIQGRDANSVFYDAGSERVQPLFAPTAPSVPGAGLPFRTMPMGLSTPAVDYLPPGYPARTLCQLHRQERFGYVDDGANFISAQDEDEKTDEKLAAQDQVVPVSVIDSPSDEVSFRHKVVVP